MVAERIAETRRPTTRKWSQVDSFASADYSAWQAKGSKGSPHVRVARTVLHLGGEIASGLAVLKAAGLRMRFLVAGPTGTATRISETDWSLVLPFRTHRLGLRQFPELAPIRHPGRGSLRDVAQGRPASIPGPPTALTHSLSALLQGSACSEREVGPMSAAEVDRCSESWPPTGSWACWRSSFS